MPAWGTLNASGPPRDFSPGAAAAEASAAVPVEGTGRAGLRCAADCPGRSPSLPGTGAMKGVSERARLGSPPLARRVASERSDFLELSREGPGAERKTIGIFLFSSLALSDSTRAPRTPRDACEENE